MTKKCSSSNSSQPTIVIYIEFKIKMVVPTFSV